MPEFSSGAVVVSSGVTSTGVFVVQTARLDILDGGMAVEAGAKNGGSVVVSGGGVLHCCSASSGGTVTVLYDGYASDVTVEDGGCILFPAAATRRKARCGPAA